jgi:hypothetical protein
MADEDGSSRRFNMAGSVSYKTKWSAKRSAVKLALANDMEMRVGYPITRPRTNGIA